MPKRVAPKPELPKATWRQVMALRLDRHHLRVRASRDQLVVVVRDMVGLHAQVMSAAELQLAARVDGIHPSDVRDALWTERRLVKAWSMRGTLHLLTPEDLTAFVAAAATRERWHEAPWLRFVGMTEEQVEALVAAVGDLLSDQPMTRAALADGIAERLRDPKLASALRSGWGIAGTWELTGGKTGGLAVQPFGRLSRTAVRALDAEADRLAAFLDRPLRASVAKPIGFD